MVLEGRGGGGTVKEGEGVRVSEQGVRGKRERERRVERVFVFCVNSPPTGRRWRARVNSKMDRKNTIDQQIGQSETVLVMSFLLLFSLTIYLNTRLRHHQRFELKLRFTKTNFFLLVLKIKLLIS